jgi:hypothetical protein
MKVFQSEQILTFVSNKKTLKDKTCYVCNSHDQSNFAENIKE